jgi:hypothetical protein
MIWFVGSACDGVIFDNGGKMKPLLAIDPGASGGFALLNAEGITAQNMPGGMTEQIDLIRSFAAENPGTVAILEKVGTYRPGNSGPAAATFARHCGHLEAALYAFGIPTEQVAPGVWQRGIGGFSSDKKKRKNEIKELMARTYPHLSVTLKTADALGILTWTLKQQTKTGE